MENLFIDASIVMFLIFFVIDLSIPVNYKYIDSTIQNPVSKVLITVFASIISICVMLFITFAVYISVPDVTYAATFVYLIIFNLVVTEGIWILTCKVKDWQNIEEK